MGTPNSEIPPLNPMDLIELIVFCFNLNSGNLNDLK